MGHRPGDGGCPTDSSPAGPSPSVLLYVVAPLCRWPVDVSPAVLLGACNCLKYKATGRIETEEIFATYTTSNKIYFRCFHGNSSVIITLPLYIKKNECLLHV